MSGHLLLAATKFFTFWGLSGLFLIRTLLILFFVVIRVSSFKKNVLKIFVNIFLIPIISIWFSIHAVEIDGLYLAGYVGDYLNQFLSIYYSSDVLEVFFGLSLLAIMISAKRFFIIRYLFKAIYYGYKLVAYSICLIFKSLFYCIKGIGYIFGRKPKKQSNVYMEHDRFWSDLFESPKSDVRITSKNIKNDQMDSSFLKFVKNSEFQNQNDLSKHQEIPQAEKNQENLSNEKIINSLFGSKVQTQKPEEYQEVNNNQIKNDLQNKHNDYVLPGVECPDMRPQEIDINNDDLGQILENKLENFGIKGKVVSITQGPAVTLFEYQPSVNTRISNILAREDDLALALQAISLRIIAPIPGKSVVGFELSRKRER